MSEVEVLNGSDLLEVTETLEETATACDCAGEKPGAVDATRYRVLNVKRGYENGWSFTPLKGKVPVGKGWQSVPREKIEEALGWAESGNIGLRTGRSSGIVVVDVDPGGDVSGLRLPRTVTAITGRGGLHLYFKTDREIGNSAGKLGPKIDVRGDGGQVVFVGSIHPDTGKVYYWEPGSSPGDVAIPELPESIVELLMKPKARPPSAVTGGPIGAPGDTPYGVPGREYGWVRDRDLGQHPDVDRESGGHQEQPADDPG
jgi:hypothetical protein